MSEHQHHSLHRTHASVANRLKRASGHLRKIVTMMEEGRSCVEIAQQLHAVQRAVESAKTAMIHDHLDHCLQDALTRPGGKVRQTVAEFRAITKFL